VHATGFVFCLYHDYWDNLLKLALPFMEQTFFMAPMVVEKSPIFRYKMWFVVYYGGAQKPKASEAVKTQYILVSCKIFVGVNVLFNEFVWVISSVRWFLFLHTQGNWIPPKAITDLWSIWTLKSFFIKNSFTFLFKFWIKSSSLITLFQKSIPWYQWDTNSQSNN